MRSSTSLARPERARPWSPPDLVPRQADPDAEQALVPQALAEAQALLEQARQEARQVTEAARQEGLRQAREEMRASLEAARAVVQEVQAWRERMLAESQQEVVELVLAVARQLFGEGVDLSPEALKQAVTTALEAAKPLGALRIHLHPQDAARLEPAWLEAQADAAGQEMILVPDESVLPGGCFIEGERGTVDARVETKLQQAAEALLGVPAETVEVAP